MSRNVREQEQKVFNILYEYIPKEMEIKVTNVKRKIFLPKITYDVIEKAKLYCSDSILEHRIAMIQYNASNYICVNESLFEDGIRC